MSREDIVAIATRLFAIFLVVMQIRYIASVAIAPESVRDVLLLAAAVSVPFLLVAALLWFFPLTVARKLLPVMKEPRPLVDPGSRTALELALTAIGFWVLAMAIVDMTYWITYLFHTSRQPYPIEFGSENWANAAATVVELLLGGWLVFGSRGLAAFVTRLRYAGDGKG